MTPEHVPAYRLEDLTQPAGPPKRRRWPLAVAAGAAVVLVLALVVGSYLLLRPESSADDRFSTPKLLAACHEKAKEQLRAPGTAVFSGEAAEVQSGIQSRVTGVVDAQNGFGALLRLRYVCLAVRDDAGWTAVSVEFSTW